jgi:hypothetical protein
VNRQFHSNRPAVPVRYRHRGARQVHRGSGPRQDAARDVTRDVTESASPSEDSFHRPSTDNDGFMENADSFHRPSTNNDGFMEDTSPADHLLSRQSDVGASLQDSAMIDPQLLGEDSTRAQLQARLPLKSSGIKMTLRSLSKKLASELAVLNDDSLSSDPNNFHFECPVRSCPWVFDTDVPYSLFAAHVGTHALELFNSGRFRTCYFGCREGFIDEIQRRRHAMRCPSYGKFPLESKVATPCPAEGCSYNGIDHATHWSSVHNPEAYSDARNTYRDECCRKAWMDPHIFHRHIVVTTGKFHHQCTALK